MRSKQPSLTDEGIQKAEKLLGVDNLYDPANIEVLHHVTHRARDKRLADICFIMNVEDT